MNWLLDALFPRFCLTCGAEGKLLCESCRASWWHEPPEPTADHLAVFAYANPTVRQLITSWKYEYDHSAWELLQEHAAPLLAELKTRAQSISVIVPMPLSSQRERERGFNQSELIARWLSHELHLPVLPLLSRAHRAGHQADRSVAEREAAMTNTPFRALRTPTAVPSSVLLVDDVWTTGATMEAAKKALTSAGIQRIFAFTLAKG